MGMGVQPPSARPVSLTAPIPLDTPSVSVPASAVPRSFCQRRHPGHGLPRQCNPFSAVLLGSWVTHLLPRLCHLRWYLVTYGVFTDTLGQQHSAPWATTTTSRCGGVVGGALCNTPPHHNTFAAPKASAEAAGAGLQPACQHHQPDLLMGWHRAAAAHDLRVCSGHSRWACPVAALAPRCAPWRLLRTGLPATPQRQGQPGQTHHAKHWMTDH
jgi:hypothetical protein